MANYDHYIFELTDLGEALQQINDDGDKIISTFYTTDSNQVVLITEKKPDFTTLKEKLSVKDKEEHGRA